MITASLWGTLFKEEQNPAYGLLRSRSFFNRSSFTFRVSRKLFPLTAPLFYSSIEDAGDVDKILFVKSLNSFNKDFLTRGSFCHKGGCFRWYSVFS